MLHKPVLHGDNGATLTATTVLAMLNRLGVKPSYSRPRVSDDNAFAESLFRTAKYRPELPAKGFENIEVDYHRTRRHSANRYLSPGAFEAIQVAKGTSKEVIVRPRATSSDDGSDR